MKFNADPTISPATGPPGIKPIRPINPPAVPNLASLGNFFSMKLESLGPKNPPFLFPLSSTSPNKKCWNFSDFVARPIAAPIPAPNNGPPTSPPASDAAPPIIPPVIAVGAYFFISPNTESIVFAIFSLDDLPSSTLPSLSTFVPNSRFNTLTVAPLIVPVAQSSAAEVFL